MTLEYSRVAFRRSSAAKLIAAASAAVIPLISFLSPVKAYRRVATADRLVALTFDDGPSVPCTSQILAALQKYDVHATFFMLGEHIVLYPDAAREVVRHGHEIGNHAYHHRSMLLHSHDSAFNEINITDHLIRQLGAQGDIDFRPPYGMRYGRLSQVLTSMRKKCILYDVIAQDWAQSPAAVIARRVIEGVRSGSIVLFHDGRGECPETVRALDLVIPELQSRKYDLVPVSQLLASGSR